MATKKYDDLSKEELVRLLESRDRRDSTRFGLVWEANEIDRDRALNGDFVALDLVAECSCPAAVGVGGGAGWRNLIIEGDNFDALRYLKMTFSGRVKCIYIDPPYNTGNKDFVYNDHYVDREDLWRHSKWCEFMYQRLTLARDLLRQDGVIFVSIDDNELHSLAFLLQRVFGERNSVGTIIWRNVTDNNPTRISMEHEYIACFGLNIDSVQKEWKSTAVPIKDKLIELAEQLKAEHPDLAERQAAYTKWFRDNKPYMWPLDRYKYIDDGGIYTGSQSVHNPGKDGFHYDIYHPVTGKACKEPLMGYRFAPETMAELIAQKRVLFGDDHTKIIELKLYAHEYKAKLPSVIEMDTRLGANELRAIFPESKRTFSFPKPSDLIAELLGFTTQDDDLVLDFFAGSGTTAHAVHKLNKEDGGNRRVILVSSTEATEGEPNKNICKDVCAERVRRVICGYGNGDDKVEGLGGDFAYLRTRRIPLGELTEIDHAQVWTALQLTHCQMLAPSPSNDEPIWHAAMGSGPDHEGHTLFYVPHLKGVHTRELVIAVKAARAAMVYSWQPDLMKLRLKALDNVQIEAVPESLARRFGVRL